jgi:hypothetical protein
LVGFCFTKLVIDGYIDVNILGVKQHASTMKITAMIARFLLGLTTLTTAGSEATAFGILLDPAIDTAEKFSNNLVTGSVARSGSFKGQALIVGVGTNVATLSDALRKNDIFVEGPISVPVAAAAETEPAATEEPAPAQA